MAQPVAITTNDGSLSWEGGVNSLKPTTVQSPTMPNGLPRNQLSWLVNATVRGGGITCRDGWQYKTTANAGTALFQGGFMYEPLGADPYLVLSIGGILYAVDVGDMSIVSRLSADPALENPPFETKAYFIQAEQFLIIQAGDNTTLPLFWDGTTLRRSIGNGLVLRGYIDVGSFTMPAVGNAVTVPVTIAYAGALNSIVVIDFLGRFQVTAIAGLTIDLTVLSTPYAGATITSVSGTSYGIYESLGNPELPAATCMDYYMGRVWYAQGRNYIAGDIVKGPSGTLAYQFRDSVLKVTENPLAVGGDGFTVPGEAGNIRCLTHTAELDTTLGQGNLYIGTSKSFYRLNVPVSRSAWIAAADSSQPLQTVAQLKYGPVNDRSVVQINGDLMYQTLEPAIRSLILARRNFTQWGNVPISRNEERVLAFSDRALSQYASGIEFSNRMWQTVLPYQTPVGVAFKGVVPLDLDLISTLEQQLPPAWEGMYEGLDLMQLYEADFGGRQRAFAVTHSRNDGSIQVWELSDYLTTDMNVTGESRITWVIEFPAFTCNEEFLLKKLVGGELWVDKIYGTVNFKLEYRPDGDACWHFWNAWSVCSARNSCEDVYNPVCYPITPYEKGYKDSWSMPVPPVPPCQPNSYRPANVAHQFQSRLTITGFCRVRGFLQTVEPIEQRMYHDVPCPGETPITRPFVPGVIPPPTVGITADNGFDPIIGPPYPPTNYALVAHDDANPPLQPRLTWNAPDVIIGAAISYRYDPFLVLSIDVTNYAFPAWSPVETYIANSRVTYLGVRYVSLANANLNHQPDTSPGQWTPDPTVFQLWKFNNTSYVKIGDSNTVVGAVTWDWATLRFTARLASQSYPFAMYIVADAGIPITASSNVFGFTDNCFVATPTGFMVDSYAVGSAVVLWSAASDPGQDFVVAYGSTAGGPYDIGYFVYPKTDRGGTVFFDNNGTYYGIVCARTNNTCVSAGAAEVTFIVT